MKSYVQQYPVPIRKVRPEEWPTMMQEAEIRRNYADRTGHIDRAEMAFSMGLTTNTVNAIIEWHKTKNKDTAVGGPEWLGEEEVPSDETVRCPQCRARLSIWIPGHDLLGCRVCRVKEGHVPTLTRKEEI